MKKPTANQAFVFNQRTFKHSRWHSQTHLNNANARFIRASTVNPYAYEQGHKSLWFVIDLRPSARMCGVCLVASAARRHSRESQCGHGPWPRRYMTCQIEGALVGRVECCPRACSLESGATSRRCALPRGLALRPLPISQCDLHDRCSPAVATASCAADRTGASGRSMFQNA